MKKTTLKKAWTNPNVDWKKSQVASRHPLNSATHWRPQFFRRPVKNEGSWAEKSINLGGRWFFKKTTHLPEACLQMFNCLFSFCFYRWQSKQPKLVPTCLEDACVPQPRHRLAEEIWEATGFWRFIDHPFIINFYIYNIISIIYA